MIHFTEHTIKKVVAHLATTYGIILEPLYDKETKENRFDYFFIDWFENEEYFVFVITTEYLHIASSKCDYMVANYTPDDFKTTKEVLELLDKELPFYL